MFLTEQGIEAAIETLRKLRKAPSLRKSDSVSTIPDQPFSETPHTAPVRQTQQQDFSGPTYTTFHNAPCPHLGLY
jgi:hypothetical protein